MNGCRNGRRYGVAQSGAALNSSWMSGSVTSRVKSSSRDEGFEAQPDRKIARQKSNSKRMN